MTPKKGVQDHCESDPEYQRHQEDQEETKKPSEGFVIGVRLTLGVNNGLRISDLLGLRVGDVRELEIGQTLDILETKTGKMNVLMVNKETRKVLDVYLDEADPGDEEFLFKSRKGVNCPITKSYVNQKVKEWTRGMRGNYGLWRSAKLIHICSPKLIQGSFY